MAYYKLILKQEFLKRTKLNPKYSLRSFAKFLEVDPAVLSRVLSNKRSLSFKVAQRILKKLNLSEKENKLFLESIAEDFKQKKLNNSAIATSFSQDIEIAQLDQELFQIIADWYHYAILQLTFLDNFVSDPAWIAKRLGISTLEVRQALQRLKNVGLLEEKEGKYVATKKRIDTKNKNISTSALRKHQKQMLQKAIFSIENHSLEKRAAFGLTFPIDTDKIPIAKELIQKFIDTLCHVLSSGKKTAVYQLSICLFPLEVEEYSIPKISYKNVSDIKEISL